MCQPGIADVDADKTLAKYIFVRIRFLCSIPINYRIQVDMCQGKLY